MTDRKTASSINDDDLDQLYRRIETLEHVAAGNKRHVQLIVPELERAEATIERVREECDRIAQLPTVTADDGRADRFSTGVRWTLRMIRTALDEPDPATTQATNPDRHAQSGIHTPGCDCGHDGMGTGWHPTDCPWRTSQPHATDDEDAWTGPLIPPVLAEAIRHAEADDEYEQTTGHVITCTAVFTGICDCPPTEPTRPTPCDQYAGLLQEILYADHITSDRLARWRERLDNLTDQEQP